MNTLDAAYNGIPLINGEEYSWGNIKTCINGIVVTGITSIAYGDKQDMQNNYGAGRHPVSRSYGRITPSAKITLYMSEVVAISRTSQTGRMQDIAPFDIEVGYLPPQRHHRDRQDPQLPVHGKQTRLERGRHEPTGGT